MKKHMLSLLIVLCGAIVVVLLFAQNHISGKRIADIIEEGDIDRISVEKWQVVDSKLVLTDSNEYAYNGNELVHDISQLKLKNIRFLPRLAQKEHILKFTVGAVRTLLMRNIRVFILRMILRKLLIMPQNVE